MSVGATGPISSPTLAGRNLGTRNSVARELIVNVGSIARISSLDVSWDLSRWCKALGAPARDAYLCTADVELGSAAGVMDGQLFDAKEVVAGRDA